MTRRRKHKTSAPPIAVVPVIRRQVDVAEPVPASDLDDHRNGRHRTVDTLSLMLTNGTITQDMHAAGRHFEVQFAVAALDTIRCMPLTFNAGGRAAADLTDAQVDARRRVSRALDALGGLGSPAGSCVWHIVGLQCSIRAWAMRQGWSGRPIGEKQAQGILIAALGTLAGHYGYERSGNRR